MVPPAGDGASPAPIDRPILEFLRTRLAGTSQVQRATIVEGTGHLELRVGFEPAYYPETVNEADLAVRWYTNDDFKVHYRESHADGAHECRWDRHPNSHNSRDHFHPPPEAPTPGEDASWPADHRDELTLVLDEVERRIEELWDGASTT